MSSGSRTRYNVVLNSRGFMLRGTPQNPAYSKHENAVDLRNVDTNDPTYNPLNQAGWSYWAQTDWSGGAGQTIWSDASRYDTGDSINATSTVGSVRLRDAPDDELAARVLLDRVVGHLIVSG